MRTRVMASSGRPGEHARRSARVWVRQPGAERRRQALVALSALCVLCLRDPGRAIAAHRCVQGVRVCGQGSTRAAPQACAHFLSFQSAISPVASAGVVERAFFLDDLPIVVDVCAGGGVVFEGEQSRRCVLPLASNDLEFNSFHGRIGRL